MTFATQFDDLYEYCMLNRKQIEESNEYTRSLISNMFQQFLQLNALKNRANQHTPILVHSKKYTDIPSYIYDPFISQR